VKLAELIAFRVREHVEAFVAPFHRVAENRRPELAHPFGVMNIDGHLRNSARHALTLPSTSATETTTARVIRRAHAAIAMPIRP
jgi:hypothetical protein